MNNITIANNNVEGQDNFGTVRVRVFHLDVNTGDKQPSDIVFDIPVGAEERVNLHSAGFGFEVRPLVEGSSFASVDPVAPDVFGIKDAYEKLKAAIKKVPTIRADMTLTETDRDAKAAAAWAEALRLAQQ